MPDYDPIRELHNLHGAYARFLSIKGSIPDGEHALKYMRIKDLAILDRGMKRWFGYGLEGSPPFIPLEEFRKRRLNDASCTYKSTVGKKGGSV